MRPVTTRRCSRSSWSSWGGADRDVNSNVAAALRAGKLADAVAARGLPRGGYLPGSALTGGTV
jgi:hypothetical protein